MPKHLFHSLIEAFEQPADSASILQGVRKMRSGRPHVRIVLAPSPKNGQHFIPCEGRLESALALSLEIDPTVAAYRTQPFEIPGPSGRPFVCDFAVRDTNHRYVVIDVKPQGQLGRPSVIERMRYVRAALGAAGIPHRIVTEVQLQAEPARGIREQLRKGAHVRLAPYHRERLLETIGRNPITVRDLRGIAKNLGLEAHAIEKLTLLGELTFPLIAPWCETTLIGVPHGTNFSTADRRGTVRDVCVPL